MSKYTMYFKDAISVMGGEIHVTDKGTILNNAHLVGLGSYPIHHPPYRERLNGMIVDRYMNREIGSETVSEFRRVLRSRMNEIMPLYLRMYEADQIKFDPTKTVDIRTIMTGEADGSISGTSTADTTGTETGTTTGEASTSGESSTESESKSRGVSSQTPQQLLKGDEDYASSAADQTGKSTGSGETSESSESEQSSESESRSSTEAEQSTTSRDESKSDTRTYGFQGNVPELIRQYRESLVNTDMMVLDDLETCFLQIFGTDDTLMSYPWHVRTYPRF